MQHQNLKFTEDLRIDENNYAENLIGLNAKQNLIIGLGTTFVENYIRDAYSTKQITKDELNAYLEDLKALRTMLKKGVERRRAELEFRKSRRTKVQDGTEEK